MNKDYGKVKLLIMDHVNRGMIDDDSTQTTIEDISSSSFDTTLEISELDYMRNKFKQLQVELSTEKDMRMKQERSCLKLSKQLRSCESVIEAKEGHIIKLATAISEFEEMIKNHQIKMEAAQEKISNHADCNIENGTVNCTLNDPWLQHYRKNYYMLIWKLKEHIQKKKVLFESYLLTMKHQPKNSQQEIESITIPNDLFGTTGIERHQEECQDLNTSQYSFDNYEDQNIHDYDDGDNTLNAVKHDNSRVLVAAAAGILAFTVGLGFNRRNLK